MRKRSTRWHARYVEYQTQTPKEGSYTLSAEHFETYPSPWLTAAASFRLNPFAYPGCNLGWVCISHWEETIRGKRGKRRKKKRSDDDHHDAHDAVRVSRGRPPRRPAGRPRTHWYPEKTFRETPMWDNGDVIAGLVSHWPTVLSARSCLPLSFLRELPSSPFPSALAPLSPLTYARSLSSSSLPPPPAPPPPRRRLLLAPVIVLSPVHSGPRYSRLALSHSRAHGTGLAGGVSELNAWKNQSSPTWFARI